MSRAAVAAAVALRVPRIVVIGGGDVGAVSLRQLLRASAAGRLDTDEIVIVDHDAGCAAARDEDQRRRPGPPRVRVELAEWDEWLDGHLGASRAEDHLVPYHWGPHLLVRWLAREVERAGGRVAAGEPLSTGAWPFQSTTASGDRALSYATWLCPPLCIEPALCPHTRGARDWSLAADLDSLPAGFDAAVVLRSLHLVWGIGTIRIGDVLAARDRLVSGLARGRRRYVVSTASHCHGLAASLDVRPVAP